MGIILMSKIVVPLSISMALLACDIGSNINRKSTEIATQIKTISEKISNRSPLGEWQYIEGISGQISYDDLGPTFDARKQVRAIEIDIHTLGENFRKWSTMDSGSREYERWNSNYMNLLKSTMQKYRRYPIDNWACLIRGKELVGPPNNNFVCYVFSAGSADREIFIQITEATSFVPDKQLYSGDIAVFSGEIMELQVHGASASTDGRYRIVVNASKVRIIQK
jgi:hypothetical protein